MSCRCLKWIDNIWYYGKYKNKSTLASNSNICHKAFNHYGLVGGTLTALRVCLVKKETWSKLKSPWQNPEAQSNCKKNFHNANPRTKLMTPLLGVFNRWPATIVIVLDGINPVYRQDTTWWDNDSPTWSKILILPLKSLLKKRLSNLLLIIKLTLIKSWKASKSISLNWKKNVRNSSLNLLPPSKSTTF